VDSITIASVEKFMDEFEEITRLIGAVPHSRIVAAMSDLGDRISDFISAHEVNV
jgi:hypothetical protein